MLAFKQKIEEKIICYIVLHYLDTESIKTALQILLEFSQVYKLVLQM